jgi:hypothetical protein
LGFTVLKLFRFEVAVFKQKINIFIQKKTKRAEIGHGTSERSRPAQLYAPGAAKRKKMKGYQGTQAVGLEGDPTAGDPSPSLGMHGG